MASNSIVRLRSDETAARIGVSISTLAKWRMRREGPPFHRCGPRIIYYRPEEIEAWLAECDQRDASASRKAG